jgi:hypothetical protein
MSGADAVLIHNIANRSARSSETGSLRLILLRTEALRVPKSIKLLRVLSGTAWISMDGRDVIVLAGAAAETKGLKTPAVVSAAGTPAVIVEMR